MTVRKLTKKEWVCVRDTVDDFGYSLLGASITENEGKRVLNIYIDNILDGTLVRVGQFIKKKFPTQVDEIQHIGHRIA